MKKKDIPKPAMLYAAEEIYSMVSDIKIKNPEISVIEAVERYIGSKSYQSLSSGEFHNELLNRLQKDKAPKKTIELLLVQKKVVVERLKHVEGSYFSKSSFPLDTSQTTFDLLWRMCESYELWCKEINDIKSITLRISE